MIKGYKQTDELTDNAISRVAFATENQYKLSCISSVASS